MMLDRARTLDRGRLLLGLLIAIALGIITSAPSDSGSPPKPEQWNIRYGPSGGPAGGVDALPATPENVLAHLASGETGPAGGGAAPPAGHEGEAEGHETSELPTTYIPGIAPSADLAAVLRQSERRNTGGARPATQFGALALTRNPNVRFIRQSQVDDLVSGQVDPRVVDLLNWIASRDHITITSMRTDHSTCVAGSFPCRVSAHHLGRAFDIGAVNGQICTGVPDAECGRLYEEVVNGTRGTQHQPSQVIYGYDPWPHERWNFEMGNHHDHIHVGY